MEAVEETSAKEEEQLHVKKHVKYLQRVLGVLPYGAKSMDVNRYTVVVDAVILCTTTFYIPSPSLWGPPTTLSSLFPCGPSHCPSLPLPLWPLPLPRMTLLFFGVCGLDILNSLDAIRPYEREQIIEWIYAQQILPHGSGT